MTCGGDTAKAINYIQKLCEYKEFQLKGMACICGCPTEAIEYKNNTFLGFTHLFFHHFHQYVVSQ